MNKQKKTVLLVMIMATLVMGIAYAAVSNITLTITGTASTTASSDNFKVYFTAVKSTSSSTDVQASVTSGERTATLNVSNLTKKGDSAWAIFEILNASNDVDAESVTVTKHEVDTTIIDITAEMCDAEGGSISSTELASGAKTYVKVTAKLLQTPTADDTSTTINVELTATPKQAQ